MGSVNDIEIYPKWYCITFELELQSNFYNDIFIIFVIIFVMVKMLGVNLANRIYF